MMMEVVGDVLLPYMLAKIINQGIAEKNVAYIIKIGAIMGFIAVIMAVGGVLGAWFASKAARICAWIYLKKSSSFPFRISTISVPVH